MKRYILTIILIIGSLNFSYGLNKNVVFAEIFYDSPLNENITITPNHNGEYVKIKNVSSYPVDISSWRIELSGANHVATFLFPANTILYAGKVAIICYQYDSSFNFNSLFLNWHSNSGNLLFYHRSFYLSNKGNTLSLQDSDNNIIDKIVYGKDGLYASNGEGKDINLCKSIHRISVSIDAIAGTFIKAEYQAKVVNPMASDMEVIIPSDQNGCNLNQNFITKSVLITPINNSTAVINTNNAIINTQYYDGFGRKLQMVGHKAADGIDDLVDYIEYNKRGRVSHQWLPVAVNSNGALTPRTEFPNLSHVFYGDEYACSQATYENSVANRPIETKPAGESWHNATGVTTEYRLNNSSAELTCINYRIDLASGALKKDGIYPPGQLYVTSSRDQDGGTALQFVNKNDSTILMRQLNDDFIDTYYIYDRYGNLCYVLPPMAVDEFNNRANGVISDNNEVMQKYAYIYKYDYRNRCISKKLPGAASIYMVYDRCDLLTYAQDGNQRSKNEWTCFAYDMLGRMAYSGVKTGTTDTHASLQELMRSISPRAKQYPGGVFYGYVNSINGLNKANVNIVNYYDNYTFLDIFPTLKPELSYSAKSGFGEMLPLNGRDKSYSGLLTGSMCKVLDNTGKEIVKAVYYDDRGQVVQSRETNHLGGFVKKYYNYSFTGKPLTYRHENSITEIASSEEYTYTYDNMDRLLTTKHSWYDGEKKTLSSNTYNSIGQLSNQAINDTTVVGYSYNIRGWLTSIDCPKVGFKQDLRYETKSNGERGALNGNISEFTWNADGFDRRYRFDYDDINRLTKAIYSQDSRPRIPISQRTKKYYFDTDYSTSYSYDKHCNITSLTRKGLTSTYRLDWITKYYFGMLDSLQYTYNGNQKIRVDNGITNQGRGVVRGFVDGVQLEMEYLYDANGNMVQDLNKGIVAVEYNYLNLPKCVTFNTGQVIEYVYDASGTKRSTIYKVQPEAIFAPIEGAEANIATAEHLVVQSRKDYCDSHIYNENSALTTVLLDNGYIGDGKYNFFIKDYQGNNRVVFDQSGVVEQVNHYYPYGGTFAEGLATTPQPYKFGGKELERMNGLDWSDFGARMLDSASPSWGTIDPMAEKYYSISPYTYCAANPILYVDPNGEDWFTATYNGETFYYYDSRVKNQEDVERYYSGASSPMKYHGESEQIEGKDKDGNIVKTFVLYSDGSTSINGNKTNSEFHQDGLLHIGNANNNSPNNNRDNNLFGSFYIGSKNPVNTEGKDYFGLIPASPLDHAASIHDRAYDKLGAKGFNGALFDHRTAKADYELAKSAFNCGGYKGNSVGIAFSTIAILKYTYRNIKNSLNK